MEDMTKTMEGKVTGTPRTRPAGSTRPATRQRFTRSARAVLTALTALLTVVAAPATARAHQEPKAPADFVSLRAVDPTILQDMRYSTVHNFVGSASTATAGPCASSPAPPPKRSTRPNGASCARATRSRSTTATGRSAPSTTSSAGPRTSTTRR